MSYLKANDLVETLIKKFPPLRDNDNQLICNVWHRELKAQGIDPDVESGTTVMKAIAGKKVTSAESITRCRRKLQEDYPEYRGKLYAERHNLTDTVKTELGYET